MPDTTIQPYSVPKVSTQHAASNEAAVAILDNSLDYINEALNDMAARLAEAGSKNAIIRHAVPVGDGVSAGTLVYFNTETSLFEPAIAKLEALPGENGASIEAPSARVEGLILRVDASEATGTMLCGGYYEDDNVAQNCLGENAVAGTYYLSPYTAGKATTDTEGLLRQPVLSYYGDGKFSLSLFYLAHDNHYHTTAILQDAWTEVPATAEDIPDRALWMYDGSLLASSYVGVLSPITTALFWNGVLQNLLDDPTDATDTRSFVIYKGVIYCREATKPEPGSVTIFNHFPFAYNSSVVRSIQSTNPSMLAVEDANGVVTLTPYEIVGGGSNPSAMAVAAIVGGTASYTPVVPGINAGPGMAVSRALNGVTTVSLSTLVGDPIDAHSIQNNGSTVITDGVLQFFCFPAGRSSELVMFLPVTDVPDGIVLQASAWATLYGASTTLSVNGYFIEQPTSTSNTLLPDTTDTSNPDTLNFSRGASGTLTYAEIELTGCTVSAPGMLVARIRPPSTPTNNIQLLRLGFKLAIASAPTVSATEPTDNGGMVTAILQAAEGINAGQPVYINSSGLLAVCEADDLSCAGLCVGVAFSSGGVGSDITYVISGVTTVPANNLIPGSPVYINTDGSLICLSTESDVETFYNGAEFLQRVGTAVTSNLVQVHIESAITKGV